MCDKNVRRLRGTAKILPIICLVMTVCLLSSCGEYNVKILSRQDTEPAMVFGGEEEAVKLSAKKVRTVEYNGQTYEAEYETSFKSPYFHSDMDKYVAVVNGKEFAFFINRYTDEIVKYLRTFPADGSCRPVPSDGAAELTSEQCREIALKELSKIDRGFSYALNREDFLHNVYCRAYVFGFVRKIHDIETADTVNISVNTYGDIICVERINQNSLADVTEADFTVKAVERAVDAKLRKLYRVDGLDYDLFYTLDTLLVVKLRNGNAGVLCAANVTEPDSKHKDPLTLFVSVD